MPTVATGDVNYHASARSAKDQFFDRQAGDNRCHNPLLVFAPNDEGIPEEFHFEWKPLGITDLISKGDYFDVALLLRSRTIAFGRIATRIQASCPIAG